MQIVSLATWLSEGPITGISKSSAQLPAEDGKNEHHDASTYLPHLHIFWRWAIICIALATSTPAAPWGCVVSAYFRFTILTNGGSPPVRSCYIVQIMLKSVDSPFVKLDLKWNNLPWLRPNHHTSFAVTKHWILADPALFRKHHDLFFF